MPVKIELAPLCHDPSLNGRFTPVDMAYAEAGRTLFGLAGVSIVVFPKDGADPLRDLADSLP